jgi:hypothetical protein
VLRKKFNLASGSLLFQAIFMMQATKNRLRIDSIAEWQLVGKGPINTTSET